MYSYTSQDLSPTCPEISLASHYRQKQSSLTQLHSNLNPRIVHPDTENSSDNQYGHMTSTQIFSSDELIHFMDTTTQIRLNVMEEQELPQGKLAEVCTSQEFVWIESGPDDHVTREGHDQNIQRGDICSPNFSYLTTASRNPLLVEAALTDSETDSYNNTQQELMHAPSSPEMYNDHDLFHAQQRETSSMNEIMNAQSSLEVYYAPQTEAPPVNEIMLAPEQVSSPVTYGIPISSTPIHSLYPALVFSLDCPQSDYHLTPVSFRSSLIIKHIQENIEFYQNNSKLCNYLHQLLKKYKSCSRDIESERMTVKKSSASLDESLEQYYDNLHHSLLDRVEKSLTKLYAKHGQHQLGCKVQQKPKYDTDQVLVENRLNTFSTHHLEHKLEANNNQVDKVQDMKTPKFVHGGHYNYPEAVRTRLVFESPENGKNIPEADTDGCKPPKVMLNGKAVKVMDTWFNHHRGYPYPCARQVRAIAEEAGISPQQVRKWFANRRIRTGFTKKAGCGRGKRASGIKRTGDSEATQDENQKAWKRDLMRAEPNRPIRL